ncbi:MAG: elongation factor Ts [Myxococcales bacterium]|nr:MAG: elongation factor Ts [Myxococcales bacterium]
MANITASMVKELREKTGAGMLDCKNALTESNGEMEAAIDHLRKKGLAAAAKKSGRITSEGLVGALIAADGKTGVLLEVNCETDFVARNPDFQGYVKALAEHIAANKPKVVRPEEGDGALWTQPWAAYGNRSVGDATADLIGKIGENISPRRFARWELSGPGRFSSYIHMGGKLGVLLEVGTANEAAAGNDKVAQFAKFLGMQIAAANPLTVTREQVPAAVLERERAIYKQQVIDSGKPANIADKIVEGKISKFYKDSCVIEQEWVHDTSMTVGKVLAALAKEIGSDVTIRRFVRWQLGEGLEKRSNDIAADVAAQLKGK